MIENQNRGKRRQERQTGRFLSGLMITVGADRNTSESTPTLAMDQQSMCPAVLRWARACGPTSARQGLNGEGRRLTCFSHHVARRSA